MDDEPSMTQLDPADDYPTCLRTYATLCILGDDLNPDEISATLAIAPTRSHVKGQPTISRRGVTSTPIIGGWFLSSDGEVTSKDSRHHIDWILAELVGREAALARLRAHGHRTEISCYWTSAEGHGGPTLSHPVMKRLGELEIEIWFDFYCLLD